MGQVQARKDRIVTGLTKGVEFLFKKHQIDWIKGTARLAGRGEVEVVRRRHTDARGQPKSSSRPGRRRAACPASTIDHTAHHHERPGDWADGGADVAHHPGQRSGRRRVRVDLQALRGRGHRHRAAAAARADRGRGGVGGARESRSRSTASRLMSGTRVTTAVARADGVDVRGAGRRRHRRRSCRRICFWSRPAALRSPRGWARKRPASCSTGATSRSMPCTGRQWLVSRPSAT